MTSVNIDEMMKVILRLKKKILIVMKQRDAAIEEVRIACESRDAVIEEARIACESRDAIEKANMVINNSLIDLETLLPEDEEEEVAFDYGVIEEVRIANESRDAAIEEARIANESRDAAIEEARIANESRDAAIEEARIANESRDAAIEEVRIANESRDAAISHLDKWKNKYERKEYLERLLPKDEVRIAHESRDAAIEEVRIANESRDAAIEEARIANESRDEAISHLDKWKNKYIIRPSFMLHNLYTKNGIKMDNEQNSDLTLKLYKNRWLFFEDEEDDELVYVYKGELLNGNIIMWSDTPPKNF